MTGCSFQSTNIVTVVTRSKQAGKVTVIYKRCQQIVYFDRMCRYYTAFPVALGKNFDGGGVGVREGMERGGWVGENVSHDPC